ncbi:GcrA family cell cycle regulator [Aquisediminimonas sediminicola]|uniref:GcrA family cell cycle regulator n=1 Tax=Alteraquisediminimonas sediminicola TaxID=2676787 RepID=UPI001C8DE7BE|nr:GcrA family cell cycle regulator [Aquisediminimonas sediminicola]
MAWTEERIALLKKMWEEGRTASQIAEELGGVSRNAVIGKAHRLDLQSRPSPVRGGGTDDGKGGTTRKAPAPRAKPAPRAEAAPKPVAPTPAPSPASPPPFATSSGADVASTPAPRASAAPASPPAPRQLPASAASEPGVQMRSIGPGGFLRQGPGDQQAPIPPAPPRRLVPAKPSAEIAGKTSLLDLNDKICKWPIGHPGEPDFHFCGDKINPGFPYCVQHCGLAYQAQMPRRDRRPPPPLPYGAPRVR